MTPVSHIVLVRWKSGAAAVAEESIRPALRGFIETIPGIIHIVEGHSSSPEGLEAGFEYGFVITFESAQARDAYLPHPRHRVVGDAIGANAEQIVVFDVAADSAGGGGSPTVPHLELP